MRITISSRAIKNWQWMVKPKEQLMIHALGFVYENNERVNKFLRVDK